MNLNKKTARIAGVLYLLNGITSGFAFAYVIAKVYVADDAALAAANRMNEVLCVTLYLQY
jgi:uncharacterized membrane protein YdjX (TVP38/TMEM64 family)